ncbi:hydroxysqualene dehydroxylase HpnE [soil metagenome]
MSKKIIIIGGGIAGISSAVFCKELGFDVGLYEASPKLGGRAYSFYDKEQDLYFDNGQHILAGWYENTLNFLKIIGSVSKLNFQNSLEVNFFDTLKNNFHLKIPDTKFFSSPTINIIRGIFSYNALSLKDKFSFLKLSSFINKPCPETDHPVSDLFLKHKQTERLVKYFWEPFLLAVFNASPENISSVLLWNVLKTGFKDKNSSALLIPDVNLNELYIDNSISYFNRNDVRYNLGIRVSEIEFNGNDCQSVSRIILENGENVTADEYICAVPFYKIKELVDQDSFNTYFSEVEKLRSSSITSVHLFFEDDIPEEVIKTENFGMTGLIGTKVQWVFKRSARHLSLVISGSDFIGSGQNTGVENITEMNAISIVNLCIKELSLCFKGFERLKIKTHKVIKEKRATFLPESGLNSVRIEGCGKFENLSFAGDWTDTGLPSTLESAVKSSASISDHLKNKYQVLK